MKSMRDCIMLQIFSPVLASVFVKVSVLVKTKKEKHRKKNKEKQVGSMHVTCAKHTVKQYFQK